MKRRSTPLSLEATWLSLASFLILLLGVFIALYAGSDRKAARWKMMSESLRRAFEVPKMETLFHAGAPPKERDVIEDSEPSSRVARRDERLLLRSEDAFAEQIIDVHSSMVPGLSKISEALRGSTTRVRVIATASTRDGRDPREIAAKRAQRVAAFLEKKAILDSSQIETVSRVVPVLSDRGWSQGAERLIEVWATTTD